MARPAKYMLSISSNSLCGTGFALLTRAARGGLVFPKGTDVLDQAALAGPLSAAGG